MWDPTLAQAGAAQSFWNPVLALGGNMGWNPAYGQGHPIHLWAKTVNTTGLDSQEKFILQLLAQSPVIR